MLGKIEVSWRRAWQRMIWLGSITDSMDTCLRKLWERVKDREAWRAAARGVAKGQTWCSNWTTAATKAPTNTTGSIVLYCNRFIVLFTQVIVKRQTQLFKKVFNLTVQCLEKFSSILSQLVYRGWCWVNSQEIDTTVLYSTVYSTVRKHTQKHNYLKRMHKRDSVSQTRELTMWPDMQMHVCIFENSQLEGSSVRDLLYW